MIMSITNNDNNMLIIKTKDKCCAKCKGIGEACDKGFAWIYCEIRMNHDEQFEGDCGETLGCDNFIKKHT